MKKDNLTDIVQAVPKTPVNQEPKREQTVVANNGDIITLGNKK
jgi:hypothetical protein